MVVIAQLVRASVCGAEGRGFESHWPPKKKGAIAPFFSFMKKVINLQKFQTFV